MRTGKIGRLPFAIRTELNQRLRDAQRGTTILAWLNSLPAVRAILAADFDNKDISRDNLKSWRQGGYQDWLKHQDQLQHTSLLAERSLELARACGGNITEGASALLAGQIFEVLEAVGQASSLSNETNEEKKHAALATTTEALTKLTRALVALRQADQKNVRLAQIDRDLDRKDEMLRVVMQKMQQNSCESFLRWRDDQRAIALADSDIPHAEKIAALGQLMFGDDWIPGARTAESA